VTSRSSARLVVFVRQSGLLADERLNLSDRDVEFALQVGHVRLSSESTLTLIPCLLTRRSYRSARADVLVAFLHGSLQPHAGQILLGTEFGFQLTPCPLNLAARNDVAIDFATISSTTTMSQRQRNR